MAPQKFPAISLTFRPKGGLRRDMTDVILKFIDGKSKSCVVTTEMEGENKHLHAVMFLKKPVAKGDLFGVGKTFYHKVKDFMEETGSIYKVATVTKGCYNDDFVKYCKKNEDGTMDLLRDTHLLEEERMKYYVDIEPRSSFKYRGDPYACRIEQLWEESHPERSPVDAAELASFMAEQMYSARTLNIIYDSRQFKNKVRHIYRFMTMRENFQYDFCDGVTLDDYFGVN